MLIPCFSWGKFAQKSKMAAKRYFVEGQLDEFHEKVFDDRFEVNHIRLISDVAIECTVTSHDEFVQALPNTSEVVGAFTTCWARLELYEQLQFLGDRVLYLDTDRYAL